jgi:hypothetical protein
MPEAVKHYRAALKTAPVGTPGLSDTASAIATGLAYDPAVTPQQLLDGHCDWAHRFAPRLAVSKAASTLRGMLIARQIVLEVSVHDSVPATLIGDRVRIMETRPMSKLKRWRVIEILERAK